jgi:hypothetical protein
MAQTGYTPIQLYRSTTASAAPIAGNLNPGELAININDADMALYAENASGVVKRVINNPAGLKYPTADGTSGQPLVTDGAGNLSLSSTLSITGVASFADGTVSLPSITNIGDTNTGIFFPAADTVAVAVGGVEIARVDSGGLDVVGTVDATTLSIGGTAITATAAELNYVDGVTSAIQTQLDNRVVRTSSTGSAVIPASTTGNRDGSPSAGYFRFNTTVGKFEGYSGTAWGSVGGGATGGGSDAIFFENGQTVTASYTITAGNNAMTAGPVSINGGVIVTIPSGSVWTIV